MKRPYRKSIRSVFRSEQIHYVRHRTQSHYAEYPHFGKTMPGDMDMALATWLELVSDRTEFNGVLIKGQPRISETEKWRYWRCDLDDGSKLSVNIQTKLAGDKSALAINHDKLSTAEDVERWRTYWSTKLKQNML